MRFRTAVLAATSAVALLLTVSGAASAAPDSPRSEGAFTYRYYDEDGDLQKGDLVNPPSGVCLDIPEVIDVSDAHAFRPHNNTDSSATVFKDGNCEGDAHYTLKAGGRGSDKLLVRSVIFA